MTTKVVPMIACALMLLSLSASAVETLTGPTALDLHVAYCLGVEEVALNIVTSSIKTAKSSTLGDTYAKNAQATQQRLDRLNTYLDGRRLVLKEEDLESVVKQGFVDANVTVKDAGVRACFTTCAQPFLAERQDTLTGDKKDRWLACTTACNENMPKLMTCTDLSWLP